MRTALVSASSGLFAGGLIDPPRPTPGVTDSGRHLPPNIHLNKPVSRTFKPPKLSKRSCGGPILAAQSCGWGGLRTTGSVRGAPGVSAPGKRRRPQTKPPANSSTKPNQSHRTQHTQMAAASSAAAVPPAAAPSPLSERALRHASVRQLLEAGERMRLPQVRTYVCVCGVCIISTTTTKSIDR